jgi:hypothetical protein
MGIPASSTNIPAVPENGLRSEIGEAEMNVTGGCFCGHVTYEATVDPARVYICHCTDCQRHSGAAYGVVVAVVDQQFRLLAGKLKTHNKTADSGTVRVLTFCPECGTRIHATSAGDPDGFMGLRLGTVDQRDRLPPVAQAVCRSAQGWVADLTPIPRFEGGPQSDES